MEAHGLMGKRARILPNSPQCKAKSTRTGKRCGKVAILGGTVCRFHGGAAPQVKAAAAQRVRDMLAEAIDPNRILREEGRIGLSNVQDLFDDKGNVKPLSEWPEDAARAVASVEVVTKNLTTGDGKVDEVIKIKLWDKQAALTNLMKHHGQLVERLDVTVGSRADRIIAARKRVDGDR